MKLSLVALVLFAACSPARSSVFMPVEEAPSDDAGSAPSFGDAAEPPNSEELTLVIRDFKLYKAGDPTTNPDFENVPQSPSPWPDKGIVTDRLGPDRKPVYRSAGTTLTTHGKAAFDQWFRDVPGVNHRVELTLKLTNGGYDSNVSGVPYGPGSTERMFFPIDGAQPFGNQGDPHNYAFTAEVHTLFTYRGGETFAYRGDDDVFVYIDGRLVIDLGGIHDPERGEVALDALGLSRGETYPLDFFFAERHKFGSNFLFTTTLKLRPAPR